MGKETFQMHICKLLYLDLLLSSAQNWEKCTFFDNLRIITQEGNMETTQMNPFFSSTFAALPVSNIHF